MTINRFRSDHYGLDASLRKINIVDHTNCDYGNDFQDLNHIFWQCPLYDTQRIDLIAKLNQSPWK